MGGACSTYDGEERSMKVFFFVGKPERKRSLGRLGVDGRVTLKWLLNKTREGVDWFNLTPEGDKWRAAVNTAMNRQVPWNAEENLTSWGTVSFSRRILLHIVNIQRKKEALIKVLTTAGARNIINRHTLHLADNPICRCKRLEVITVLCIQMMVLRDLTLSGSVDIYQRFTKTVLKLTKLHCVRDQKGTIAMRRVWKNVENIEKKTEREP